MIGVVRAKIVAAVVVASLAASAGVVAVASTSANGLPAYTNGYKKWPRLNEKPVRGGSPAHRGVKNVYASKRRVGRKFPNGTVVVKTIQPAGRKGLPYQVAVMRKTNGRWKFVEYQLSGSRYTVLAQGQLCQSCHVQARARDYVFTR